MEQESTLYVLGENNWVWGRGNHSHRTLGPNAVVIHAWRPHSQFTWRINGIEILTEDRTK